MGKAAPTEDLSPATPRSRKGAETRARLLEGAKLVFEETGFLEARVTDIADRAGLSHGAFYHYFESKEQIFREVADLQEERLLAPPDPDTTIAGASALASASAEVARIYRANRSYLERYRDNGKIMGVIEEVSRYDPHVREVRMRRQQHFGDLAERSIRRLQAAGLADPEVDAEIAALALGSMVARFAEIWLIEGWGSFDLDQAADQLTRLWANAIGLELATPHP